MFKFSKTTLPLPTDLSMMKPFPDANEISILDPLAYSLVDDLIVRLSSNEYSPDLIKMLSVPSSIALFNSLALST